MLEQNKKYKGSFFSTTCKTRFMFRGLKMLFFKKKARKGGLFLNSGDLKMSISRKKE